MTDDATPPSLRITGRPTAEEVAAVVVALNQVAAERAAAPAPRRAPWQYAARVESVGGRIVRSPADITPASP